MQKVELGKTGVFTDAICLGAMYFGSKTDIKTSYEILDRFIEYGGSFIDTANTYAWWVSGFNGGESESLLGRWIRERKNRGKVFIASKVGFATPADKLDTGLSRNQIERACENSLKRLGINTIDLYYAHVDDRNIPMEESLEAFDKLVKSGKVRLIGASNFVSWRLQKAQCISKLHGIEKYCCMQTRFSYLRPRPGSDFTPQLAANEDLLDYCNTNKLTLLAYSPLLQGIYTRSERPVPVEYLGLDNDKRLEILKEISRAAGVTANQLVLSWMINNEPSIIPVIGVSSTDQLDENLKSLEIKVSDEQIIKLNNSSFKLP